MTAPAVAGSIKTHGTEGGTFPRLGLRFDIEIPVIGTDRHREIVQETLESGQAEGMRPRITEPDRRVPGELLGAVGHGEIDTSKRPGCTL